MRGTRMLLGLALAAAVLPVLTAGPAQAATTVQISAPGTYASDPSSTPAGGKHTRALGGAITVAAGQTHYLSSKLNVTGSGEVTEVSHLIYCRRPGQTTNAAQLVTGQNVLTGASTTLLTRGFVTAPADSALTCAVYAQFVNHHADVAGHITVLASSYLQDVDGAVGSVGQTFNAKTLVNSSLSANVVHYTAPAGASTIQAIGDLNVTACYGAADNGLCVHSAGARMGGSDSLVGTQLVANQLNADGGVCHTTTNGDLAGVYVTSTVHHFKINTWLTDVPVLATCSSRAFTVYTRVTANAAHNSFVVEANNQSVGAAFTTGSAALARAVPSKDFGPMVVTGIPAAQDPALQLVVPLATIESPQLAAGSTAYVYSELTASAADQVNLVDNEIRCTGAGSSNVVMGENVLPPSGDPAHQDITIVNRFLVTATSPGVLSCTLSLRTSSTSAHVARETVSGTVRFASYSVPGDATGVAMQKSLPAGNTVLSSTVVAPVLDDVVPAGYSKVDVVADMEFHWCSTNCTQQFAKARFALTVTTSGGSNCAGAPVAQVDETVARGVNHAAIPLYTTVAVQPGCTHLHAQVTSTYLAGNVGLVGGAAAGLTDTTGHSGDLPNHTSAMSHVFALPRTN